MDITGGSEGMNAVRINHKNIGAILSLGVVAMWVGTTRTIQISLPTFSPVAIAPEAMTYQNSIGSFAGIGIVIGATLLVSIMIYGLVGLGGMGGRR
jgi:hypothetical protein